MGAGNRRHQGPCSGRVYLQEDRGWGSWMGRPTWVKVLLVQIWVEPRSGKAGSVDKVGPKINAVSVPWPFHSMRGNWEGDCPRPFT